ncbi:MAG: cation-efflux pump [Chloroflexi bacterium]|nr:cation-efflux pump [Chloroflexota bacterium]
MSTPNTASARGERYSAVQKVLWSVLIANLLVTVLKIGLGLITGALAVVADGFHSLVDSSSNLIGVAAIRMAQRPADERFPYGYSRYETLGALAIGGLLLVAAWEISSAILGRITTNTPPDINPLTLVLVILTLPVNILVVVLETRAGKRLKSEILLADAKHTRTDLYVTASVVLSLLGVRLGWVWLDALVAGVVVILIVRAAFGILGDTTRWLADANVADSVQVETIALNAPGVRQVHRIRSRGTPDAAFVDLHVKVAPDMSTAQAHAVASEVERRLIAEVPYVSDALVHIEPARSQAYTPWEQIATDLRQIADGMGLGLHDLHIHTNLDGVYTIELHLEMGKEVSLGEAHRLADQFEERVQKSWPKAENVITHLEPVPQVVFLPDEGSNPELETKIREALHSHVKPDDLLSVKTYLLSGHHNAAVKLCLPADLSLAQAHTITEHIETDLLKNVRGLERVTVHVEPEPHNGGP